MQGFILDSCDRHREGARARMRQKNRRTSRRRHNGQKAEDIYLRGNDLARGDRSGKGGESNLCEKQRGDVRDRFERRQKEHQGLCLQGFALARGDRCRKGDEESVRGKHLRDVCGRFCGQEASAIRLQRQELETGQCGREGHRASLRQVHKWRYGGILYLQGHGMDEGHIVLAQEVHGEARRRSREGSEPVPHSRALRDSDGL